MKYDKVKIKEQLTTENIFELFTEFNGNPTYSGDNIIADTICHHHPADNPSHKLYFYSNSKLCNCFTGGCEETSFDIFQLVQKVAKNQWNKDFDLNDSVRWIANRFNIFGENDEESYSQGEDWKILAGYDRIKDISEDNEKLNITLETYDDSILDKMNYSLILDPWLKEGITQEVLDKARIGYFPSECQITIPHYDINNQLIGIRGRTMVDEEAEMYGKYRPLKVEKQLYNHPLGFNLYGLNWNKDFISQIKKAIIFESEKSVLMYASYFGWDNNIAVACCGSNVSNYQIQLLLNLGVDEIIFAFDRQFQEINDDEHKKLVKHLLKINDKYGKLIKTSFIFDKNKITNYKASPIDEGKDKFLKLFNERIFL